MTPHRSPEPSPPPRSIAMALEGLLALDRDERLRLLRHREELIASPVIATVTVVVRSLRNDPVEQADRDS